MSLDVTLINEKAEYDEDKDVFSANITHNLGGMADEAGIYDVVWHPEKLNIKKAGEIIKPLSEGIEKMQANPEHYEQFNASNGWGKYKDFLPWLKDYLNACIQYPDATIHVSR